MAYLFRTEGQVCGKPGRRRQQLASAEDREVFRVDRIWREEGEPAWLVSFFLAEIGGRLECVGFGLRSFLAVREDRHPERPKRQPPVDLHGYDAWVPCPMPADESDERRALRWRLRDSGEEPALRAKAEEELSTPMPLSATRVRRLPYGHLLNLATRETAGFLTKLVGIWEETKQEVGIAERVPEFLPHLDAPFLRHSHLADALGTVHSGQPRGRDENAPTLERIASLYEGFYRAGSSSPTRDVAEALSMSRSTAAKRVMECRKAGLLAPTSRGRAGGMKGAKP